MTKTNPADSPRPRSWSRRSAIGLSALLLAGVAGLALSRSAAQEPRAIPAPAVDMPDDGAAAAVVLAGGCFWGVQGVFQHIEGVTSAVSGYAGGDMKSARYEIVSSGRSAHAEAVRVAYDPHKISYGRILQVFFSVAHDPTQLNRQGPDLGPQYRSAVFPANAEQTKIAKAYIAQLNQARVFDAAIVTTLEADRTFFPAEDYHQDFMTRHPTHPYSAYHDLPKIDALKRLFPELYRAEPTLVTAARP